MFSRRSSLRAAQVAALLTLLAASAQRAAALVIDPTATINTVAPADDPGWLNVGDRGVYLGDRWVLTARHVGPGATVFPGVGTFAYETGSRVDLVVPGPGPPVLTDLVLYRLTTAPNLPSLTISSNTPNINSSVTLIGDGRSVGVGAAETEWFVTGSGTQYTWTEVAPGSGNVLGYSSTGSTKLWGTNLVEDDGTVDLDHNITVNSGWGPVVSFFTEFDKQDITNGAATTSEAQALGGDSGSGGFAKNGANWELAGITHAIGIFHDQPGFENPALPVTPPQAAIYGNLTYIADLSAYRDQILAVIAVPELNSLLLVGVVGLFAVVVPIVRKGRCADDTASS